MMSPLTEGTIVNRKYRIERMLGAGGMGIVVAATHLKLEQRVAIKFLHPEMLKHPEIVERFLREARAASRIEGDHVARVIDVDTLDDGVPFLVMEYLDGRDLSGVRKAGYPLPSHEAVGYVLQACAAVAEAHHMGIIHRDLKPANIFLAQRRDGSTRVKVLDFGISKLVGAPGEASVTRTSAVMGSAEYMSPEQMVASRDVDPRADIWALGVVLYELCTARVPFQGDSITHMAVLVMTTEPLPAITLVPAIPPGLDAIIRRCLEKDRERRFSSVPELMSALAPFAQASSARPMLSIQPSVASPARSRPTVPFTDGTGVAVAPFPADAPGTMVGVGSVTSPEPPRRSSAAPLLAIIGALLTLALLAGGLLWLRPRHTSEPADTQASAAAVIPIAPPRSAATPDLVPAVSASVEAPAPTVEPAASTDSPSAPPANPHGHSAIVTPKPPPTPAVVKPAPSGSAKVTKPKDTIGF
jgi:serine/threonine-protein kinase